MSSPKDQQVNNDAVEETILLLNLAADATNWTLVKDLLLEGEVDICDAKYFSVLRKLASATGVSHVLVREIVKKTFSSQKVTQELKNIGENIVVEAVICGNWDTFMDFLSATEALVTEDIALVTIVQSIVTSQTLRRKPYLHMDVFIAFWRNSKQSILDCKEQRLHNTLVQMAAELNMWSRVCDLLVAKPDLNVLDRGGLSVVHRLVMCPDSRCGSLLPFLLEHGADVRLKNLNGETALHLAAKHQKIIQVPEHSDEANRYKDDIKSKLINECRRRLADLKLKAIEQLISSCHKLDDRDSAGKTAVVLAAENDNWEFLKLLLKYGARCDLTDDYETSVLHVLVHRGTALDPVTCKTLIHLCVNAGAQINSTDIQGYSPLHLAVCTENWILFKQLVDFGADPQLPDGAGLNSLHRLALTNRENLHHVWPLFLLLSQRGADLNNQCPAGDSILHLAAQSGNLTLVKRLIDLGTTIHHSNKNGFTVLHLLAFYPIHWYRTDRISADQLWEADSKELLSVLDLLIDKGADLESRCSSGDTALHLAAKHENWTVFTHLLQRGAWIYKADTEGVTVMQRFVQSKMKPSEAQSIFQLLAQRSAVTNARNSRGDSVLQLAAKHEKWTVVEHMMMAVDEDPRVRDSEGFNILDRVAETLCKAFSGWFSLYIRFGFPACQNFQNCELHSLVSMAARSETDQVVPVLLDLFHDVNVTDWEGFTLLHRVVQGWDSSSAAVITRLVEKGADVEKPCPDGNTAVHIAAKSSNWVAVQHLLRYGASGSSFDNEGKSVLHRLVGQPHPLCEQCKQGPAAKKPVFLLSDILSKGARTDQNDHHGNTPLHLAVRYEHWDMMIELLAKGASLTDRDSEGCTVLHILAKRDNSVLDELSSGQPALPRERSGSHDHTADNDVSRHLSQRTACVACQMCNGEEIRFCFLSSSLAKQGFDHLDMCDLFVDHTKLEDACDSHGNTALTLSAKHNNWDITERLLQRGANSSLKNCEGLTLLHFLASVKPSGAGGCLAEKTQMNILNSLISQGVDVTARDPEGNTPTQLAAKHRNMGIMERLLDFTENVNEADSEGFTLLSRVAQTPSPKSRDIARRLLQNGADVHMTCLDGKTPFILSVLCRNWPLVSVLLGKLDVSLTVPLAEDLLFQLIEDIRTEEYEFHEYEGLIRWIWEKEENTASQRSSEGRSVMQLAFVKRLWNIVGIFHDNGHHTDPEPLLGEMVFHGLAMCVLHTGEDNPDFVFPMMPSSKLNMDLRDEDGDTPLNILAKCDSWNCVKLFFDLGADVSLPDSEGWTLLHRLIVTDEWYDMVTDPYALLSTLVERGSDVEMAGPNGKTAAMMALEQEDWSVFWHLLQLGAKFDWANCDKRLIIQNLHRMPRKHIQEEKLTQIVKRLTETRSRLRLAETTDCVCFVQRSFERCVLRSRWTAAKALLQSEAEIDITRLVNGETQLLHKMVSLYKERDKEMWIALLNTLLARGLDINCRSDSGKTVLMKKKVLHSLITSEMNADDLFTLLLSKGCNPLLVDYAGNTLLTHALDCQNDDAVMIIISLVKLGVIFRLPHLYDVMADGDFAEPMKEAARQGNIPVLRMLIECGGCSNSQLCSLTADFETHTAVQVQSDTRVQNIRQILEKAATQPRSLESLCRLVVSRAIPYGLNRTDLIISLPIPHVLKDYLIFADIVGECTVPAETGDSSDIWRPGYYFFDDDGWYDSDSSDYWE